MAVQHKAFGLAADILFKHVYGCQTILASMEAGASPDEAQEIESLIMAQAQRFQRLAEPIALRLSSREESILKGVRGGLTNKEIAAQARTSKSFVTLVIQRLMDRAGISHREELVRIVPAMSEEETVEA